MKDGESAIVFPLMFGFNDLVEGRGFIAQIRTEGRATMVFEDGEWWMGGVNPGGLAASGVTEKEALAEFRNTYRLVLQDSAALAQSFDSFSEDVKRIFASTTDELVAEWTAAALAIREGADAGPFAHLQRKPCDKTNFGVAIRQVAVETAQPLEQTANDEFSVPESIAA